MFRDLRTICVRFARKNNIVYIQVTCTIYGWINDYAVNTEMHESPLTHLF